MLFRALCCLCSNRQRVPNGDRGYHYFDSDDGDSDDEGFAAAEARARVLKLSKLKRNAIDVATDTIVAENLLLRHGDDSSLLMYRGECDRELHRAIAKIPVSSHGALVKKPYYYCYNKKSHRNGERYTCDIV